MNKKGFGFVQIIATFIAVLTAIILILSAQIQMSVNKTNEPQSIEDLEGFRTQYILNGLLRTPIEQTTQTQELFSIIRKPTIADYVVFTEEELDEEFLKEKIDGILEQTVQVQDKSALTSVRGSETLCFQLTIRKENALLLRTRIPDICESSEIREYNLALSSLPGEQTNMEVALAAFMLE